MHIGAGGSSVVGTLLVGLMVSYVLDLLKFAEGALIAIWATLVGSYIGLIFASDIFTSARPAFVSSLLLMCIGQNLLLAGTWVSVQFCWVQVQYPGIVLAAERILFACCPLACGPMIGWAVVAAVGANAAPFYLSGALAALYFLFIFPTTAPFVQQSLKVEQRQQCARRVRRVNWFEAFLNALGMLFVPALAYLGTHRHTITSSYGHLFSMLLLLSFPVIIMCLTFQAGSLWWVGMDQRTGTSCCSVMLIVALLAFTAGMEGRVFFLTFGDYVKLPSPWGPVLITAALYGAVVVAFYTWTMRHSRAFSTVVVGVTITLAALAAVLAFGPPLWLLLTTAVTTWGLALFQKTFSLGYYNLFVVGAVAFSGWFLATHFWFLDIKVDTVPMHELCQFLLLLLGIAASAPGLAAVVCTPYTLGLMLAMHAFVLARIEDILYGERQEDGISMYPPYLIVVTSVVGVILARQLSLDYRIPTTMVWLMNCIYFSKATVLFLPGGRSVFSSIPIALASTSPYLVTGAATHRERMPLMQGVLYTGGIALALMNARFIVFDIVFAITGHRPSDAVLFGGLLIASAGSCTPLVWRHYHNSASAKQFLVLTLVAGVMLVVLRPPMPWKGAIGLWYDAEHVPDVEPDDPFIYNRGLTAHSGWPCWLLILATFSGILLAFPSKYKNGFENTSSSLFVRVLLSITAGVSLGLYLRHKYFLPNTVFTIFLCLSCAAAAVFLAFIYVQLGTSPTWLPHIFIIYLMSIIGAYTCLVSTVQLTYAERSHIEEAKTGIIGTFFGLTVQLAFAIKLRVAVIQRLGQITKNREYNFGAKSILVGSTASTSHPPSGRFQVKHTPASLFMGRNHSHLRGSVNALSQRMMAAHSAAWMPMIGNLATLLALLSSILLMLCITSHSDSYIFALAPILLLLNEDPIIFISLIDAKRYAPPTTLVIVYLCYRSIVQLFNGPADVTDVLHSTSILLWTLKNSVFILLSTPSNALFINFVLSSKRLNGLALLILAPLNLIGVCGTDINSIRMLGGIGFVSAIVQYIMQRSLHMTGLKHL